MMTLQENIIERKKYVRRAYRNYQRGLADEKKVKQELGILMHIVWRNQDDL